MKGLIGKKVGMTRIFEEESGTTIPVTIIRVGKNTVLQRKTRENDGYDAVQLSLGVKKDKRLSKPLKGHLKKNNADTASIIKEFEIGEKHSDVKPGDKVGVEILNELDAVDVTGKTKGRGFAGTVKKYGFHIGRMTHGNRNKRARGAVGAASYPARVFPGLKMAGRYGNDKKTMKNCAIAGLDTDEGLVYLKGGVPGHRNSIVYLNI